MTTCYAVEDQPTAMIVYSFHFGPGLEEIRNSDEEIVDLHQEAVL